MIIITADSIPANLKVAGHLSVHSEHSDDTRIVPRGLFGVFWNATGMSTRRPSMGLFAVLQQALI